METRIYLVEDDAVIAGAVARHMEASGCRVKAEVEEGIISPSRYRSYKSGIEELRKRRKY